MAKVKPRTEIKTLCRDLKCSQCDNPSGFTLAHLLEVMDKDYVMNYYCHNCDTYTVHEFIGQIYERINGTRIQDVLDFEVAS